MSEQLLQQTGAIIKGLTILAATVLPDLLRAQARDARHTQSGPRAGSRRAGRPPQLAAENGAVAELPGTGDRRNLSREVEPNLIADLTSKMGRSPQKRLEQMIEYDEEQAAAILKQWMRGAQSA